VPAGTRGNVKVVGLLPGWPFAVRQDPTLVPRGAQSKRGDIIQVLQKFFSE
jgi:hypothetical protein